MLPMFDKKREECAHLEETERNVSWLLVLLEQCRFEKLNVLRFEKRDKFSFFVNLIYLAQEWRMIPKVWDINMVGYLHTEVNGEILYPTLQEAMDNLDLQLLPKHGAPIYLAYFEAFVGDLIRRAHTLLLGLGEKYNSQRLRLLVRACRPDLAEGWRPAVWDVPEGMARFWQAETDTVMYPHGLQSYFATHHDGFPTRELLRLYSQMKMALGVSPNQASLV